MTYDVRTEDGQKIAFDELALFFNNATIAHGYRFLRDGQTEEDAIVALIDEGGFSLYLAIAFVNEQKAAGNLTFKRRKLVLPDA